MGATPHHEDDATSPACPPTGPRQAPRRGRGLLGGWGKPAQVGDASADKGRGARGAPLSACEVLGKRVEAVSPTYGTAQNHAYP